MNPQNQTKEYKQENTPPPYQSQEPDTQGPQVDSLLTLGVKNCNLEGLVRQIIHKHREYSGSINDQ